MGIIPVLKNDKDEWRYDKDEWRYDKDERRYDSAKDERFTQLHVP